MIINLLYPPQLIIPAGIELEMLYVGHMLLILFTQHQIKFSNASKPYLY